MSVWASWGEEDEVKAVAYRENHSNHYPTEREDERLTIDFAHIPAHLNREYRRQRWLRVGVFKGEPWVSAEPVATFCLTVPQAKKLSEALDYFVNQPKMPGRGE